jgi:hypothetical protein
LSSPRGGTSSYGWWNDPLRGIEYDESIHLGIRKAVSRRKDVKVLNEALRGMVMVLSSGAKTTRSTWTMAEEKKEPPPFLP